MKFSLSVHGVQGILLIQVIIKVCVSVCIVIAASDSSLDNVFRQYIDGIDDNSFIKIIDPDIDEDNELNCPQIIIQS